MFGKYLEEIASAKKRCLKKKKKSELIDKCFKDECARWLGLFRMIQLLIKTDNW